jgi:hypothetical protein
MTEEPVDGRYSGSEAAGGNQYVDRVSEKPEAPATRAKAGKPALNSARNP